MVENDLDYLKTYDQIQSTKVRWIWYPYIPLAKITLLQGDPGDGKSTMMLNLLAELSRGGQLPDGTKIKEPIQAMYQCSEDGLADTIKPRLEAFGADCSNIAFIDEEVAANLTLDDERIRDSIIMVKPKLVVIDPVQSYIGSDSNIFVTSRARKLMHRLSIWAAMYDCAIILISHFTKNEGTKDLYRGIGSIDVVAAARSVLQVESDPENPDIKRVKQVKNSLAPKGADIYYELSRSEGFRWIEAVQNAVVEESKPDKPMNKTCAVAFLIAERLRDGMLPANEIFESLKGMNLSDRTIRNAKKELGIISVRKDKQWYWLLPDNEGEKTHDYRK